MGDLASVEGFLPLLDFLVSDPVTLLLFELVFQPSDLVFELFILLKVCIALTIQLPLHFALRHRLNRMDLVRLCNLHHVDLATQAFNFDVLAFELLSLDLNTGIVGCLGCLLDT